MFPQPFRYPDNLLQLVLVKIGQLYTLQRINLLRSHHRMLHSRSFDVFRCCRPRKIAEQPWVAYTPPPYLKGRPLWNIVFIEVETSAQQLIFYDQVPPILAPDQIYEVLIFYAECGVLVPLTS